MIDETDKKVIALIQGDLPLDPKPFALLAERIGMSEKEFLARVASLKKKGIVRRFGAKSWPYNLYTMIHGDDREQCKGIAERMSRKSGIDSYVLLFSEKEFKKTSMEYF
jgi:DNA-binding Lrp family transcriptional regulator